MSEVKTDKKLWKDVKAHIYAFETTLLSQICDTRIEIENVKTFKDLLDINSKYNKITDDIHKIYTNFQRDISMAFPIIPLHNIGSPTSLDMPAHHINALLKYLKDGVYDYIVSTTKRYIEIIKLRNDITDVVINSSIDSIESNYLESERIYGLKNIRTVTSMMLECKQNIEKYENEYINLFNSKEKVSSAMYR